MQEITEQMFHDKYTSTLRSEEELITEKCKDSLMDS